ncbi:MAG TPA: hypothetical protein VH170_05850 [Chthoniobacterales bacterium]|jgi:hypothetical protein|nr:hypothetical protein [Chthoniobacterales bacterium]
MKMIAGVAEMERKERSLIEQLDRLKGKGTSATLIDKIRLGKKIRRDAARLRIGASAIPLSQVRVVLSESIPALEQALFEAKRGSTGNASITVTTDSLDAELIDACSPAYQLARLPKNAAPGELARKLAESEKALNARAGNLIEYYLTLRTDQQRSEFAHAHGQLLRKSEFASSIFYGAIGKGIQLTPLLVEIFEKQKKRAAHAFANERVHISKRKVCG